MENVNESRCPCAASPATQAVLEPLAQEIDGCPSPSVDFIDLDNAAVVEMWTRKFGIASGELQAAVRKVGNAAGDLYDHLQLERQVAAPRTPG